MIRCAFIDDEPMALQLLEEYASRIPFLRPAGSFRDAIRALAVLQENPVDLLFLDINMPDLTGIQFLRAFPHPPLVVFTTAYSQYAVESYEYGAVDYLLKPVEFERFLKAAVKARERLQPDETAGARLGLPAGREPLLVKSGNNFHRIVPEDLIYVEGAGNYAQFVTANRKILSLMTMQEVASLLATYQFIRVHRSFVVSLRHIEVIETSFVRVPGRRIPVGEKYRGCLRGLLPGPEPSGGPS